MKKIIYSGPDAGKFGYGDFQRFMGGLEGAEPVQLRFNMNNDLFQIWFLNDVAVKYHVSGGTHSRAVINLFGSSDEKIGKVEKIILGENQ